MRTLQQRIMPASGHAGPSTLATITTNGPGAADRLRTQGLSAGEWKYVEQATRGSFSQRAYAMASTRLRPADCSLNPAKGLTTPPKAVQVMFAAALATYAKAGGEAGFGHTPEPGLARALPMDC